jgi:hypothetical protein
MGDALGGLEDELKASQGLLPPVSGLLFSYLAVEADLYFYYLHLLEVPVQGYGKSTATYLHGGLFKGEAPRVARGDSIIDEQFNSSIIQQGFVEGPFSFPQA